MWLFRALFLIPFVFLAPEIWAGVMGWPHSFQDLSASTADVGGTGAVSAFIVLLMVTPLATLTGGWRTHLILRRDAGRAMFAIAALDITLAAITTSDTFPGGFLTRLFGHTFLVLGSLSFALLLPMVVTSNQWALKWLGKRWRIVHRLVYVVWASIAIHLLLLFGFRMRFFGDYILATLPLAILRIPAVSRWWDQAHKEKKDRFLRWSAALACLGVCALGFVPFLRELAFKGHLAFDRQPPSD